ncbi:hypothetical protein COX24_02550 [bacterium (Candidatus Gribaldobacteria) CG23_combo_of_CG06-09_8_20_14_all_37_87_8]|uniref:Glycosyltransferase 2-like domain-containing protein n=1 Tax=bacterium (Candidatus Gribaldobacteria) CG23_combo_of_CG06-09_8_20_14_all_37_87_8 TaxID=2014278 RepID=A0A2G9ZET9_9BACT|nr:MAG: hypothetical protein COX24_02550 [bacterium (Candidatus Gribaldobacteria) CG23_combo_of_CG06-09_8_20_14_all_37_87_8]
MDKKIAIGIPSYNEGDTISYVVKQVDLGLRKFFPLANCLIINVDSDSTDNTKEAFLKTQTFSSKKYLNTGKKPRGKGKNLIDFFKYCDSLDVDYIALFDSDIKTIKPNWVFSLLNPLITKKFDYTTPVYSRGCYDGNVTNNFAYPLTYAIFGVELQQPIGGEFGLSKRLYKYLLQRPISETDLKFGIDIFMTYHAIGGEFRICEVFLGKKKHKPGFLTLMDKFLQFSQSAIMVSRIYKDKLNKVKPVKKYKNIQIFKTKKRPDEKLVKIQLKKFKQDFKNNLSKYNRCLGKELTNRLSQVIIIDQKLTVSSDLWTDVLARFLNLCYAKNFNVKLIPKICHLIAPIFYWRVISFWEEMNYLNPIEIDKKIRNQAKLLRKKLITRL